ncbi:MAG: carbohydrate kinase family protein [Planctomycetota bacterium]
MEKTLDCSVIGTCTVDILVRPIDLQQPLGGDRLVLVDPITATTGGVVSNSGLALAKLGNRTAAVTGVGDDAWAGIIRQRLAAGSVSVAGVSELAGQPTSTTVVMISSDGQRSFAHCPGACAAVDSLFWRSQREILFASRFVLVGYYSLLPKLESDLPKLIAELRAGGTLVALDSAGSGGGPDPLRSCLPQLDVYFPSLGEARNQTGCADPVEAIRQFRTWGASGILGVKLGAEGVVLSSEADRFVHLPALSPPGPVLDTTGAGDAFFAGLITGLLRGDQPVDAARLGTAVAAVAVTGMGASGALPDLAQALALCKKVA